MTSARFAALGVFVTGLAGCATALANAWPTHSLDKVALIAGGIAATAGPLFHVIGEWIWQKTPVGQGQYAAAVTGPAPADVDAEPPDFGPAVAVTERPETAVTPDPEPTSAATTKKK
jgi:hypothetical protein